MADLEVVQDYGTCSCGAPLDVVYVTFVEPREGRKRCPVLGCVPCDQVLGDDLERAFNGLVWCWECGGHITRGQPVIRRPQSRSLLNLGHSRDLRADLLGTREFVLRNPVLSYHRLCWDQQVPEAAQRVDASGLTGMLRSWTAGRKVATAPDVVQEIKRGSGRNRGVASFVRMARDHHAGIYLVDIGTGTETIILNGKVRSGPQIWLESAEESLLGLARNPYTAAALSPSARFLAVVEKCCVEGSGVYRPLSSTPTTRIRIFDRVWRTFVEVGELAGGDQELVWSRDGRFLAVSEFYRESKDHVLWLYDLTSGTRRQLGNARYPSFSPCGRVAGHTRTGGVVMFPREGGAPEAFQEIQDLWSSPVWSSDGRWIAGEVGGELILVDRSTGARTSLGPGADPRWSHTGVRLVFSSDRRLDRNWEVWAFVPGGAAEPLLHRPLASTDGMDLSPTVE